MLGFWLLRRRVINFADPESQKGFVYLPFLLPSSSLNPPPWLMGSSVSSSSWFAKEYASFRLSFSRRSVSPFIHPSFPRSSCLSLSIPPFSALQRFHPPEQRLDPVRRYGVVQLKSSSDRKLQYSGSYIEKRRPELGERYRQLLRDRINRMESKNVECFE